LIEGIEALVSPALRSFVMQGKKIVMFVAVVIAVLMLLFPPTLLFIPETAGQKSMFHFEYMFIFSIPEETRINGILLLSQWFGLLLGTALVLSLFNTHSEKSLLPKLNEQDAANGDSDGGEQGKAGQ
jgi:hypothetical protein